MHTRRFALALLLAVATSASAAGLEQLTVTAGGHPLALWARTVAKPRGVIVLIHGRTWSSLPDFDLQVPGESRSVMQALNAKGYSTYALDLRGYGKSPRNEDGWNTPDQAASDVAAALEWLAKEKQVTRPALLGWSNGSLVVQLLAQQRPELISELVLYGYPRDALAAAAAQPVPPAPPRAPTTRAQAISDFISPAVIDQKTIDAYAAAALAADPVRTDWKALDQYNQLDPSKVTVPALLIQGERDPLALTESQARLFTGLANPDKQWVVLAGGDYAALLEDTAPAFIAAIVSFVERPKLPKSAAH